MSIHALARGLELLQCFSAARPAWGVTELSLRLGLHKSRVHRILQTLVKAGFVVQDRTTSRYRLGWNLFHLAQAADPDHHLRTAARPHLLRLREQTTGSIYLRVIRDGMNLIIDTLESSHPLRLVQPPGTTRPAHFGASGKVLLAFGPAWLREAVVAVPRLKGFTSRTIVDRDGFLEELERVRRQGYAFTNEEAVMGVRSVAAPVLSPDGTAIAAVASALPAQALPLRLVPAHARAVVACTEAVSRSLFAGSQDGGSASGPAPKSIGRGRRARPAGRSTRKNRRKDGES